MRLHELNDEVETIQYLQLVEKYEREYTQLFDNEQINEELLDEGVVAWIKEKSEIGSFLMRTINDQKDPNKLENLSGMINKGTYSRYVKGFTNKIISFIKKIDEYLTQFSQNNLVINALTKIKELAEKIKNVVFGIYNYAQKLKGFKKLAAVIGVSGLMMKVSGISGKFFGFIEEFSTDFIAENVTEFLKKFQSLTSVFDFLGEKKDELVNTVESATGNLIGLGAVLKAVSMIKDAIKYIYGLIKSAKDKIESVQVAEPVPA